MGSSMQSVCSMLWMKRGVYFLSSTALSLTVLVAKLWVQLLDRTYKPVFFSKCDIWWDSQPSQKAFLIERETEESGVWGIFSWGTGAFQSCLNCISTGSHGPNEWILYMWATEQLSLLEEVIMVCLHHIDDVKFSLLCYLQVSWHLHFCPVLGLDIG